MDVGFNHRVALAVDGVVPGDAEVLGELPGFAVDVGLCRAL